MSGSHTPSTEPAAQAEAGSKASSPAPESPKPLAAAAAAAAVDTSNDTTTTTTSSSSSSITNEPDKASQDAALAAQQTSRESSREEGEEDSSEEEGEEPEPPPEATSSQPPLPPEAPPTEAEDSDGWQPIWDGTYQAYYFYNSHTNETTWTNPRVPEATLATAVAGDPPLPLEDEPDPNLTYNPAIHGDYDPTAPYAQVQNAAGAQGDEYVARGAFNRFTGKFQPAASRRVPENYNDENKSRRQMEFYFDVDAAASTHDGRSLKAERQTRKLSRKEVREFQEKRKARKEEKRKAWLRD
ncbi:uncharacterized protein H6S33_003897 [Morchella sextelata]|uniref:uncharacterized protein n=1 Tax=Morchella sextelata TaxID=1174677 RepID=UPI001D04AB37|nr:uncharacterized protein H6S33_003897 [Morchella sextelata]KAH0606236.1 hypothetical protein H6S33_003897 [Morchella sextelata]